MTLRRDSADGICTVTLDRPDVRNALDAPLLQEFVRAVRELAEAPPRALVITGAGGAFCAGVDVSAVSAELADGARSGLIGLVDAVNEIVGVLHQLPCPTLAAVEGPAVGAGMALALAADVRVVARSARFVPGYFNIAVTPDGGGSYFLTRMLGSARAISVVLRNRPIGSDQMLAWGLADELADDRTALTSAHRLAAELAASTPPRALLELRALAGAATSNSLAEQLVAEREAVARLWETGDYAEGVAAFLERRRPEFTGR